jgi:hypothetical protein
MLDYGPQINQYILKNADPKLQRFLQPQKQPNTQIFLDKLQETASEIIHIVSKIRRFGPDSHHPERKTTNKQELIAKLEDLLALVAVLESHKYFDLTTSKENIKQKAERLLK